MAAQDRGITGAMVRPLQVHLSAPAGLEKPQKQRSASREGEEEKKTESQKPTKERKKKSFRPESFKEETEGGEMLVLLFCFPVIHLKSNES